MRYTFDLLEGRRTNLRQCVELSDLFEAMSFANQLAYTLLREEPRRREGNSAISISNELGSVCLLPIALACLGWRNDSPLSIRLV